MITITCVRKPEEEYKLLTGKTYSVGRKGCDLTFTTDQSVSRNHATILVDHPIANLSNASLPPAVVVTDLGSKFGTFINEGIEGSRKIAMREPNTLADGDRFRFGLQWNEFKIAYKPLIATSSGTINDLQSLKTAMCELGAHLLPEWKEGCEILITETLSLTVKAVCSLLSAKSIVTPKYFIDYLEAVKGKAKLPRASDYRPIIVEKLPPPFSFEPNPLRKKLFDKKIFLFTTAKQAKKIGVALRCAGGVTDLINSVTTVLLKSENTIIIASPGDIQLMDKKTQDAVGVYQSGKKRTIPESEIGLAAVYASTERYCNPFFSMAKVIFPQSLISQTQQSLGSTPGSGSSQVIVPETQQSTTDTQKSGDSSRRVVNETVASSSATSPQSHPVISLTQSQSLRSQPMEFEVPTPRIKEEKQDGDKRTTRSRRGNKDLEEATDESSGSKRRRDAVQPVETGSRREPSPKRLRSSTTTSPASSSSSRFTAPTNRVLSSIFNMSDDEEDEEVDDEEPFPQSTSSVPTPPEAISGTQESGGEEEPESMDIPVTIGQVIHETTPSIDVSNEEEPVPVRRDLSPVKIERVAEHSKRKKPDDVFVVEVPSSSKKRRVTTAEIKRTPSKDSEGFIIPPLKDALRPPPENERLVKPIPDCDIKPLPFKFEKLIKVIKRPAFENQMPMGKGNAFNFKPFHKVLPLYLSSLSIVSGNNSVADLNTSNSVISSRSTVVLRVYHTNGRVDTDPYVDPRTKPALKSPEKLNSTGQTPSNTSVEEIEISDSDSGSPVRRSARSLRSGPSSVRNTESTAYTVSPSTSTSTTSGRRSTRATKKRSESPPPRTRSPRKKKPSNPFDEEEEEMDDEWAF